MPTKIASKPTKTASSPNNDLRGFVDRQFFVANLRTFLAYNLQAKKCSGDKRETSIRYDSSQVPILIGRGIPGKIGSGEKIFSHPCHGLKIQIPRPRKFSRIIFLTFLIGLWCVKILSQLGSILVSIFNVLSANVKMYLSLIFLFFSVFSLQIFIVHQMHIMQPLIEY